MVHLYIYCHKQKFNGTKFNGYTMLQLHELIGIYVTICVCVSFLNKIVCIKQ